MSDIQNYAATADEEVRGEPQRGMGELIDAVWAFLRRRYTTILALALAGVVSGVLYLLLTPRNYIAHELILFDRANRPVMQQQPLFADNPFDAGFFESQIKLIQSESVALRVVNELKLANDQNFIDSGGGSFKSAMDAVVGLFKESPKSQETSPEHQAAGVLLQKLDAKRVGVTSFIEVNYQYKDPELAMKIVHAVAEAYVQDQAIAKYEMTKRAGQWLQERLEDLRRQAYADEQAVNAYKAKNKIVGAGGKLMTEQALTGLNAALIEARTRTSEALARLDRVEAILAAGKTGGAVDATISDAMTNPVMTKLRQDYLAIEARYREYSSRYGEKHLAVVNLRDKMKSINVSIAAELKRMAEIAKSEYLIAKNREEEMSRELAASVSQSQETDRAQVALRELESAAQSSRALYNAFQQRLIESTQQQTYLFSDARVVGPATVENQKRFPKILSLFAFGGLALGGGISFLREAFDRTFRTSRQVERLLRLPCLAMVPVHTDLPPLPIRRPSPSASSNQRRINDLSSIFTMKSSGLYSYFAEALRAVKLGLDLQIDFIDDQNEGPKKGAIIGIISSVPAEGKSTILAWLAGFISLVGRRVLIVDCDLRKSSLSRRLAPTAELGLLDVLCGQSTFEHAVWTDSKGRVTFLPNIPKPRPADETEVFSSSSIKELFSRLRSDYDYILVDLPPIACATDVRASANWVDLYLMVVEWGGTKTDVVRRALDTVREVQSKIGGVVLNKTDMTYLGKYDTYYHKDYYHEDKA